VQEPGGDRIESETADEPETFVKRRPGRSDRLLAEARHLHEVAGPGVVPLMRVARREGEIELHLGKAGGSAADVLRERGPLTEPEVRAIGVAAATALGRVHESGLVHADVKPANLLLTEDGEVWLADLDTTVPADGRPLGRGSPGRHRVDAAADPSTDVISLAVALVELATGVIPDPGIGWTRSRLIGIACPPALAAVVEPVLEGGPPPSARQLADALADADELCPPRPVPGDRGTDPTPTVDFDPVISHLDLRPTGRNATGWSTGLLVALSVLVLVVVVGTVFV
jgi:serine/threonine protein kinase